jgi:hypothetical protein
MLCVTSDEALSLLRGVASGQIVPRLKNPFQFWNDQTVELTAGEWSMVLFTDETRWTHLDSVTSPDGRRGESKNWRSDMELSQQPEDRLYREDSTAVHRMFQAVRRAL